MSALVGNWKQELQTGTMMQEVSIDKLKAHLLNKNFLKYAHLSYYFKAWNSEG